MKEYLLVIVKLTTYLQKKQILDLSLKNIQKIIKNLKELKFLKLKILKIYTLSSKIFIKPNLDLFFLYFCFF